MKINKNTAANRIADDWLLVYPDTYKRDLVTALLGFDDRSIDEIYSFHDRIKEFSSDKKRQTLKELPKAYLAEIERMLEAYTTEISRANNEYYQADAPHLTDAQYDTLTKILRITLRQKRLWASFFDKIQQIGAKPTGRF